ncbi:MAG: HAD hydrolase-like protein [Clostridia bacterium]|nr:HAD hydrolase-like protein [Clostridia bacterium]
MKTLSSFKRQKDYLVCVDSDGCAMDTMDVKHYRCFGPCMVAEWDLAERQEEILHRWNDINLYTITRGINRFRGLAKALREIHDSHRLIDGIRELEIWVENSPELSADALRRAIAEHPETSVFQKALSWSTAVNEAISALPDEVKQPFPLVREALEKAHGVADVAIVSSANPDAVLAEWREHGLLEHVDVVMTQNDGSKARCIGALMDHGYDPTGVLMCGDAPGDMAAAEKNGVFFYPILVRTEGESWDEFIREGCDRLISGQFGGEYQALKKEQFLRNLGE